MTTIDLGLLDRISELRRFEPRTMEIAKRIFIGGEKPKALAMEMGINVPRVYMIRAQVLAAAKELEIPPGWDELNVRGPRELIARLRREFEQEMAKLEDPAQAERSGPRVDGPRRPGPR